METVIIYGREFRVTGRDVNSQTDMPVVIGYFTDQSQFPAGMVTYPASVVGTCGCPTDEHDCPDSH
jgi:hypothetical protein